MKPLPVELADAAQLKAFMAAVIAGNVTREEPLLSEIVQNVSGNVDWWLQNPHECVHLKCVDSGRIVGVVLVKDFWNLCSLFVDPSVQGQGIGRLLAETAIEACRGRTPKRAIWLNASPNAVAFYEHIGFTARLSDRVLPPGFKAMEIAL